MADNAAIVRDFIRAWSRLDPDEIAAYFTEDGVYHNIPTEPVAGRDNVRQFLKDNPEMPDEIEKKIRAKLMPKPEEKKVEEKKAEDKKPEDAPAPAPAEEATEE